jgi:photosystem II stability/assembly factor-like uncharacterized protein
MSIGRRVARAGLLVMFAAATLAPGASSALAAPATSPWGVQSPAAFSASPLESVSFVDCSNGWAVGSVAANSNGDPAGDPLIIHTDDGGATWTQQATPAGTTGSYLDKVQFIDKMNGWAVGNNGVIMRTTNGGLQWQLPDSVTPPLTSHLDGVWFSDPKHGWAATGFTSGGKMYVTSDGGINWTDSGYALNAGDAEGVFALDTTHAWAVGENGDIAFFNGTSWSAQKNAVVNWNANPLANVFFRGPNLGWVVGSQGTVLHTTNGGTTYTQQRGAPADSDTMPSLADVKFISDTAGWAVGGEGTIISTTDGGTTWNTDVTNTTNQFEGLSFPNQTRGWAVGEAGMVRNYNTGLPTVDSVTPASGTTVGGDKVVIKGCGFTGATKIAFGNVNATSFKVDSDTQVTVTTPAAPAGKVDVVVTNDLGSSVLSAADQFTFVAPPPPALPKAGAGSGQRDVAWWLELPLVVLALGVAMAFLRRRRATRRDAC